MVEWVLIFIITVASQMQGNSGIGMMAKGPFINEAECIQVADRIWARKNGWEVVNPPWGGNGGDGWRNNYFHSKYRLKYLDNKKANMGVYWSCVELRRPFL